MRNLALSTKIQSPTRLFSISGQRALVACQFIFVYWLLFFPILLSAQKNPQPYFRNYGTADGLPSPEVYCAMEDSRGYMWFGTDNGVVRFDGYEFETFDAQDGLMSNVVFNIYEDEKGRMWFGTMTGEVYIMEGGTILPYQYNHLVKGFEGLFTKSQLVHLDENETTFFELKGFGFLIIDKDGKTDTITNEIHNAYLVVHLDEFKQTLRVSCRKYGSNRFETEKKYYFLDIIADKKRFQKKLPRQNTWDLNIDIQQLPSGELLVIGRSYIHCLIDTQLIWSTPFALSPNEIIVEKNGTIWLCLSNGGGLRQYASLEDLHQNQYQQFLQGLSVSNFHKDTKGGYWITSLEEGVFYLSDIQMLTYDSRFGFSNNFVRSVSAKNENQLFVGIEDGNIFHLNIKKNQLKYIPSPSNRYHNFDLFYDKYSNVLYQGFSKWENKKWSSPKAWDSTRKKYYSFNSFSIKKLLPLSENEIIGVCFSGFLVLDKKKHFIRFSSHEVKNERIFAIYVDYKKRIWLGTSHGLFEFKDDIFLENNKNHPAFHHRIEDIDQMPDNTLVFATKGFGIMMWKDEKYIQITKDDGLTANMLTDIHVDENGTLWAASLNGLNKIKIDTLGRPIIRVFDMTNGLPSNEIHQIKSLHNQLWLCTSKGLVKFHERMVDSISVLPFIQRIKINDYEVINDSVFLHNQNNLEITYLAINYRLNAKINYRYRIHQSADWQYTQNRSVNFSALPPDTYNFQVQSQNEDKFWSESSEYTFSILPPWWATWWFRLLGVLTFIGIGYGIYYNRIKSIQKENEIKEQFTRLEKSALQAQMNPHFIFNCLNSIQNFILQNDRKKAVEYLSRFASLVRHNLDASIKGEVALEEEVSMLDNYLALEQERFKGAFGYEISVSEDLESDFVVFPSMLIQPFVENAVIHGMGGKNNNGQIKVSFYRINDILQVNITDNGSGYRQGEIKAKMSRHKSVGMRITQKRLELLDKNIKNVIDIKGV